MTQRDPILVALAQSLRKQRPAPDCSQRWRVYEVVLASALTSQPHAICGLTVGQCGMCSLSCEGGVIDTRTLRRWRTAKRYLSEHYRLPIGMDWDDLNQGEVALEPIVLGMQPLERLP